MTAQPFFSRRFLWALVIVLPLIILLLNSGQPPEPVGTEPGAGADPAFQLVPVQGPGAGRSFNVQDLDNTATARVLFVAAHDLPIIDIRMVFDAGAARDDSLPGLASLTSGLLREGTSTRDASAVAQQFEQVGARFNTGSWRDMAMVELRVLSESNKRDAALAMLQEVLREPAFSETALARDRKQALAGLRARTQRPSTVLGDTWYPALYPDHPYGSPPHGTEDSLKAITRADIQGFYQRYYNRSNVVIAIVGDLDQLQARQLANQLLNVLPEGQAAAMPATPAPTSAQTLHVEFASAQTHVRIGLIGVNRSSKDLPALMVGNEILGGSGLVSILSREIRESKGLAYSVYSAFSPMRVAGPFSIGLQTRADQADEAIAIALEQLKQFVQTGPDEAQVAKARNQLAGAFALGTASNASIVAHLASIAFYGLPSDHLEQQLEHISNVTRDQVIAAFQRHVDPERLMLVQVGPVESQEHGSQ